MGVYKNTGPIGVCLLEGEQYYSEGNSNNKITIQGVAAGWAGWEVSLLGRTALRLSGENFYLTGHPQAGMWVPPSGSTSNLFIYKANNPKKVFRLDYHPLNSTSGRPVWHYNVTKGFANINGLNPVDHSITAGSKSLGHTITIFRWGGRALFFAGVAQSAYDIYHAESKAREIFRQVSGWSASIASAAYCAKHGAKLGAGAAVTVGQLGPQVGLPEELVTVPVGAGLGGIGGGLVCGVGGFFVGTEVAEIVYDWTFTRLTKEEWIVFSAEGE